MAGTTPVLSARFFLVAVQVLLGAREDRVTYWWYFRHHQMIYIYTLDEKNFSIVKVKIITLSENQKVRKGNFLFLNNIYL